VAARWLGPGSATLAARRWPGAWGRGWACEGGRGCCGARRRCLARGEERKGGGWLGALAARGGEVRAAGPAQPSPDHGGRLPRRHGKRRGGECWREEGASSPWWRGEAARHSEALRTRASARGGSGCCGARRRCLARGEESKGGGRLGTLAARGGEVRAAGLAQPSPDHGGRVPRRHGKRRGGEWWREEGGELTLVVR
jgi:hypothetical protein